LKSKTSPEQRRKNLRAIEEIVTKTPGITTGGIGKQLGIPRGTVAHRIDSENNFGILFSEGKKGQLFTFKPYVPMIRRNATQSKK